MKNLNKILLIIIIFLGFETISAQLLVYNPDMSEFPVVKAQFKAFHNNKMLTNLSKNDFEITDRGGIKEVLYAGCTGSGQFQPASVVFALDVSGSMATSGLSIAKKIITGILDYVPEGMAEYALITFNSKNYIVKDFTNEKSEITDRLDNISANGGTSFNAALTELQFGALNIAENAVNKPAIILLTDGAGDADVNDVVTRANNIDASIYPVVINMSVGYNLRMIASSTGGRVYGNANESTSEEIAGALFSDIFTDGSCTIEWVSSVCSFDPGTEIKLLPYNYTYELTFFPPTKLEPRLSLSPSSYLDFGLILPGASDYQDITMTAVNGDVEIYGFDFSDSRFRVEQPTVSELPLLIEEGRQKNLRVSFNPVDSQYVRAYLKLITNACLGNTLYLSGGAIAGEDGIKVLKPNGGEVLLAGSDTTLEWSGNRASELVDLKFSLNNGSNWTDIDKVYGYNYQWKVPSVSSEQCLLKAGTFSESNWARGFSGNEVITPTDIMVDNSGVWVFGQFEGSADFMGKIVNSAGETDLFLARLSESGSLDTLITIGGPGAELAGEIMSDGNGNALICGSFTGDVDFGSLPKNASEKGDAFIARVDPGMDFTGFNNPDGIGFEIFNCMCRDSNGNIWAAGSFTERITIGGDILYSIGSGDALIIKYDRDLNVMFGISGGGGHYFDEAVRMAAIDGGDVYVAGHYGDLFFINGKGVNSWGNGDIFLLSFDESDQIRILKSYGHEYNERVFSLTTYGDKLLMSGDYDKKTQFGETVRYSNSARDGYYIQLDADGNVEWTENNGGIGDDATTYFAKDDLGNLILGGWFKSGLSLGSVTHWTSQGPNAFIAKIDPLGNDSFAKTAGARGVDLITNIFTDMDGSIYSCGYFSDKAAFGEDTLITKRDSSAFVWKISGNRYIEDVSDDVWEIRCPELAVDNIDIGESYKGVRKDTLINNIMINNDDIFPLTINGVKITGSAAADFAITNVQPPLVIPPGGTFPLEIWFTPSDIGARNAQIIFLTSCDSVECSIRGTGSQNKIRLAVDILDFGLVPVANHIDSINPVIENISNTNLLIDSIKITGFGKDYFSINSGGGAFLLAAGETKDMNFRFSPLEFGRTGAALEFYSSELVNIPVFTLAGTGVGLPCLVSCPDTLANIGEIIKIPVYADFDFDTVLYKLPYSIVIRYPLESFLAEPAGFDYRSDSKFAYLKKEGMIDTVRRGKYLLFEIPGKSLLNDVRIFPLEIYSAEIESELIKTSLRSGSIEIQSCAYGLVNNIIFGEPGLNITPNPVNSIGSVEISASNTGGILSVFTIEGREIEKYNLDKKSTELNFGQLPDGIYIFRYSGPESLHSAMVTIYR